MRENCLVCKKTWDKSSKHKEPYICPDCEDKGYIYIDRQPIASRKFRKNKKRKSRTVGAVTASKKVNIG